MIRDATIKAETEEGHQIPVNLNLGLQSKVDRWGVENPKSCRSMKIWKLITVMKVTAERTAILRISLYSLLPTTMLLTH